MRHVAPWFGDIYLTYTHSRLKADLCGIYNGELAYKDSDTALIPPVLAHREGILLPRCTSVFNSLPVSPKQ